MTLKEMFESGLFDDFDKIWIVAEKKNDEGFAMTCFSKGYTSFELLGLIEYKKDDILTQIKGEAKPNKITREVGQ